MVKRQKEKQYQSATEQRAYAKSRTGGLTSSTGEVQRTLPFHCCALTLTPFTNPVCLKESSVIFDNSTLLPFLLKHKKDPVTGSDASTRQVIRLEMDQNDEGQWQCPVLTKPFMDHTKIIAIIDHSSDNDKAMTTAYVYSFEAYQELCVKPKSFQEFTTGAKFHPKKDVLILNDPQNPEFCKRRDINQFWHITHARSLKAESSSTQGSNDNIRQSVTSTRIMDQLHKKRKQADEEAASTSNKKQVAEATSSKKLFKLTSADVTGGVTLTTGKASGSLTSTAMDVAFENQQQEATSDEILTAQCQKLKSLKKKGLVQIDTTLGTLILELHCDIVPKTCINFLGLCKANKYNHTTFHRLIPKFMIQGGKALKGEDASLWGPAFEDEFDDRLKHVGSGVVSMANAGPKTNKRQFFITFKSCPHLDRKHSVFGKIVKGMEVLKQMEQQPTDSRDKPTTTIKILQTHILQNPAEEAMDLLQAEMEARAKARLAKETQQKASALGKNTTSVGNKAQSIESVSASANPVGKYLPKAAVRSNPLSLPSGEGKKTKEDDDTTATPVMTIPKIQSKKPKHTSGGGFGNFSNW